MSRVPAEVDALGNFNPHYQEGIKVPVRDVDVNGTAIDISAKTWKFKTATFSKTLVADPNNVKGLLLVLTKEEIQANIPSGGCDFIIVDETADPDDVRHEGRIVPRGWK